MRAGVSLEAIEALYRERAADFFRFAPTYAAPESFGHVRFYATPIPEVPQSSGQSPVKVVGLDENGAVVACLALDSGPASC